MDLFVFLAAGNGYFYRSEAIAAGLNDADLRRALDRQLLHRVCHGIYAPYDEWRSLNFVQRHLLRATAIARRAESPVAMCGATAVVAWGGPTWGLPFDDVHLLRLDGRAGRREAGVARHRGQVLPDDVVTHDSRLVTSPLRTCADVVAWFPTEVAVVVTDFLLRAGLVDPRAVRARLAAHRNVPGMLGAGVVTALVDPAHESVGESRLFVLCWRAGLPRPDCQVPVRDERGRVFARLDMAWPKLGVWVEFDGKEKYLAHRRPGESIVDAVLREKRREERIARATGWRCIRLTWADLEHPRRTATYLARVLGGGPVHTATAGRLA